MEIYKKLNIEKLLISEIVNNGFATDYCERVDQKTMKFTKIWHECKHDWACFLLQLSPIGHA